MQIVNILASKGITGKIFEFDKCGDTCITFMERITGITLDIFLKSKNLNKEQKRNFFIKMIGVIKYFHDSMKEQGFNIIGHGDLHAGNIIITPEEEIKLIDFSFEFKKSIRSDWDFVFSFYYMKRFDLTKEEMENIRLKYVGDIKK
jgi:serine/threonine protein kinase